LAFIGGTAGKFWAAERFPFWEKGVLAPKISGGFLGVLARGLFWENPVQTGKSPLKKPQGNFPKVKFSRGNPVKKLQRAFLYGASNFGNIEGACT